MNTLLNRSFRLLLVLNSAAAVLIFGDPWLASATDLPLAMRQPLLLAASGGVGLLIYGLISIRLSEWIRRPFPDAQRVSLALNAMREGMMILDEKRRVVLVNSAATRIIGLQQRELSGPDAPHLQWIAQAEKRGDDCPWIKFQGSDGKERIFSVRCRSIAGEAGSQRGTLATFRDVSDMEQHRAQFETMLNELRSSRDEISRKNEQLEILANLDGLTSCPNRRAFVRRFNELWQEEDSVALLMIDADHFKQINDTYGHSTGDAVLRSIALCLRDQTRPSDLVCRYGGEEFCALLRRQNSDSAVHVAERIRRAIGELRMPHAPDAQVTVSIGIALRSRLQKDPQELLDQADRALYHAKNSGRNLVKLYDEAMHQAIPHPRSRRAGRVRTRHLDDHGPARAANPAIAPGRAE